LDGSSNFSANDNTDFGSSLINVPVVRSFEIQNTGTGTLNISALAINGNNSSEFSFVTVPNTPLALNPGTNYSFSIHYLPVTAGTRTAVVSIANSDADESNYTFMINAKGMMDVGLSELAATANALSVFPNPASEFTLLEFLGDKTTYAKITVLAVDGKILAEENTSVSAGTNLVKVSTSNLKDGVYFIQIKTADYTRQTKLIIQH
jgi:hypothetical protein